MTPDARAQKSAETMWRADAASQFLGFELVNVTEGTARVDLTVAAQHCNGHGTCHGGIMFALADTAFAVACNSRNQATVAQHNVISYVAPPQVGMKLIAQAREVSLRGRSGIYDVTVSGEDGMLYAEFRGFSRAIGRPLFEE